MTFCKFLTCREVNGDNSQGTALGQQGPAPNLQQVQPAVLQQVSSAPAQPTAPTGQPLAQPVQQTTAPIPLTAQQVQPTAIPGQQTMGPSTGGINTASAFLGQAAASAPQISQAQAVGGFPLSQSAGYVLQHNNLCSQSCMCKWFQYIALQIFLIIFDRMMYAVVNQPLQMGVSMQNIPLKSQTITVPDQHGIQRQHLVNEYQVHAVWSISTGQAMTQDPPSVTPPQPSLGSLPSASSTQSSVSSFMSQTTQAMGQRYKDFMHRIWFLCGQLFYHFSNIMVQRNDLHCNKYITYL